MHSRSSSGALGSKLRSCLILTQPTGTAQAPSSAHLCPSTPSSTPQCLSGACQVCLIPSPVGFQGNVTGLPLGARITCRHYPEQFCYARQQWQDTLQSSRFPEASPLIACPLVSLFSDSVFQQILLAPEGTRNHTWEKLSGSLPQALET